MDLKEDRQGKCNLQTDQLVRRTQSVCDKNTPRKRDEFAAHNCGVHSSFSHGAYMNLFRL
jgi:hypothetical protein